MNFSDSKVPIIKLCENTCNLKCLETVNHDCDHHVYFNFVSYITSSVNFKSIYSYHCITMN